MTANTQLIHTEQGAGAAILTCAALGSCNALFPVHQDPGSDPTALAANRAAQPGQGGGWMDTVLNLIPGRKQKITDEPDEDAIKRTHDYLR